MTDAPPQLPPGWQFQPRPPLLTRRFEFDSYAETRAWLDALADWSERTGVYPDLNFGRTCVNVTLGASGPTLAPGDLDRAAAVTAIAQPAVAVD